MTTQLNPHMKYSSASIGSSLFSIPIPVLLITSLPLTAFRDQKG